MLIRRLASRVDGRRAASLAIVVATFAFAFVLWLGLFELRERRGGDAFDIARWEVVTVANKWLFALGEPLRSDPPPNEAIARYYALDDRDGDEGAQLENVVEAAIEGRIDRILRDLGVKGRLSLAGPLAVWPPVDIELGGSPRVLVTSPRSRIRRVGTELLRADLAFDEAVAIEEETESRNPSLSALVVSTGGFSMYPAVVSSRSSYARALETASHEWTHHYLSFYALGFGLPSGARLTINETVADIVGDELAELVLERFGDPGGGLAPPAPVAEPALDRDAILRDLRLEVDALLAEGRVDEAERRMEQVRLELERAGIRIRRINQAFFAWIGTYAARPDSIDPLGRQIRELRAGSESLAGFLATVRDARSRADIERLLERLGSD